MSDSQYQSKYKTQKSQSNKIFLVTTSLQNKNHNNPAGLQVRTQTTTLKIGNLCFFSMLKFPTLQFNMSFHITTK